MNQSDQPITSDTSHTTFSRNSFKVKYLVLQIHRTSFRVTFVRLQKYRGPESSFLGTSSTMDPMKNPKISEVEVEILLNLKYD